MIKCDKGGVGQHGARHADFGVGAAVQEGHRLDESGETFGLVIRKGGSPLSMTHSRRGAFHFQ